MEKQGKRIRVLVAVPGFDGHWRGAMVASSALRDAGMEVIYVGKQSPQAIAEIAIQEAVDVIGLSIFSAGYMKLISKVLDSLKDKHAENVLVIVGGIIPPEHIDIVKEMGVGEIFLPGGKTESIVEFIRQNVEQKTSL